MSRTLMIWLNFGGVKNGASSLVVIEELQKLYNSKVWHLKVMNTDNVDSQMFAKIRFLDQMLWCSCKSEIMTGLTFK